VKKFLEVGVFCKKAIYYDIKIVIFEKEFHGYCMRAIYFNWCKPLAAINHV
jgi:hypothetical protein